MDLSFLPMGLFYSVENLLEMGYVNVRNLLPNQLYENVLTPTELKRDMPVDRQRTVRVYSRERARVGGISVKVISIVQYIPYGTVCICCCLSASVSDSLR
jgi:hypothetical protein